MNKSKKSYNIKFLVALLLVVVLLGAVTAGTLAWFVIVGEPPEPLEPQLTSDEMLIIVFEPRVSNNPYFVINGMLVPAISAPNALAHNAIGDPNYLITKETIVTYNSVFRVFTGVDGELVDVQINAAALIKDLENSRNLLQTKELDFEITFFAVIEELAGETIVERRESVNINTAGGVPTITVPVETRIEISVTMWLTQWDVVTAGDLKGATVEFTLTLEAI